MTENEAQKWLERFEWDDSEETSEALTTICEALQEYSKFKAIGTVEEFKTLQHFESNYEHNLNAERNKAIDEFAERLKDSLIHNYRHLLKVDTDDFEWLTTDAVGTHIDKVAEKMKGE